eukprot:gene2160-biopygen4083
MRKIERRGHDIDDTCSNWDDSNNRLLADSTISSNLDEDSKSGTRVPKRACVYGEVHDNLVTDRTVSLDVVVVVVAEDACINVSW